MENNEKVKTSEVKLVLWSPSLLSKWGFGDGDILGEYTHDILGIWGFEYAQHKALYDLVKRHLLPRLNHKVEVCFISTIHNPVRAEMIDGKDYSNWFEDDDIKLEPEFVEITPQEVIAVLKEHGYTPKEPPQ